MLTLSTALLTVAERRTAGATILWNAARFGAAVLPRSSELARRNVRPSTGARRRLASERQPVPSTAVALKRDTGVRDPADNEDILKVREFLAGDERAFESLFDKYREKVYRIAYRFVRNKEDALEVTQEVFLRVYLGVKQFKTNSRFFTWLYRITVNRAIDYTRSRKSQPVVGLDAASLEQGLNTSHTTTPDPVETAQERELEEKLREAVATLSPKHRAVFVLHAAENLSYKQIAEILDCNIGTVMSRLFYARKKLREILSGFGIDILDRKRA